MSEAPIERYRRHMGMVKELLEYDPVPGSPRLSDWEIGFIESLSERSGALSEKQAAVLDRIWAKVM